MMGAYDDMRADPVAFLRAIIDGDTPYAEYPAYTSDAIRLVINQPPPQGWVCFHCGEAFHDASAARDHFGRDDDAKPACQIKAGAEGSLVRALREAEASAATAWALVHNESGDVMQAYQGAMARHGRAMQAAEELGYERGLADGRAEAKEPA
jgi:hypothetical protein